VPPRLVDPETPALWVHSSGTSGKPKAVVHAHRFAREVERVSRERLGLTADDRLFASSGSSFAYPQTNSLWAGLKLGATVVLDPQWPTAQGVARHAWPPRAPRCCSACPRCTAACCTKAWPRAWPRPACGCACRPARRCRTSLREAWRAQTGLPMVDGYGASETLVLVLDGTATATTACGHHRA
jgi:acyl-coenzyme A synthetase/AMP-(fatty) acid ligase